MGFDDKSQKGEIHNYKNDYKFTYELKQKANGEWQVGGKIRSDNDDGLADLFITLLSDLKSIAKNRGFKIVKPVGADD
tara:strand:+ start:450 stop:683 length:234 start_codon:yes stop_codon:yes gene_type:complete